MVRNYHVSLLQTTKRSEVGAGVERSFGPTFHLVKRKLKPRPAELDNVVRLLNGSARPGAGLAQSGVQNPFPLHHSCCSPVPRVWDFPHSNANMCVLLE